MKCDKAQEFFSEYIEDVLDRPMTVALEAHLNGCEQCSADVASLRSMWTVLDKVPAVEPPADFVWRTMTRLQNEMVDRREAERARALPWWKRLTPVHSFSLAGVAALLIVGLTVRVPTPMGDMTPWGYLGARIQRDVTPHQSSVVAAPNFQVQLTGQSSATVTVTATSAMPGTRIVVTYLTPHADGLIGTPRVWTGRPISLPAGQSVSIPIAAGGARAVKIGVIARVEDTDYPFEKTLVLPGAAPVTGSTKDPYLALQQVAAQSGQAMLVDTGLKLPTALDLQSVTLEQVLAQTESQPQNLGGGVVAITK
jgi:hypothetical protein